MPADWYRPVDVERLADVGESRKFDLPLADLPRLTPALASTDGYARCRVTFAREQGQPVAEVAVDARLGLRCQRCLKPVWTAVDGRSQVRFVTDPARVDENDLGIEPTLAPDGKIALRDLVEEELLLSVPLVPRHDDPRECGVIDDESAEDDGMQKPFAGLGELLKRKQ
jgi:uncharacterized protein